MEAIKDYFETLELVPQEVIDALSTFDDNADEYKECARVLNLIEQLGWTYEYYLDGVPYNLTPMNFTWWLNSDNVEKLNDGYITQCTQWRKVFTFKEIREYYQKEYENV